MPCYYEGGAGEEAGVHHQVQAALQAAVGARVERAGQVQTGTVHPEDGGGAVYSKVSYVPFKMKR